MVLVHLQQVYIGHGLLLVMILVHLHLASILTNISFFCLSSLEKYSRGRSKYEHTSQNSRSVHNQVICLLIKAVYAFLWCSLISMVGFIIPILQLFIWLMDTYSYLFNR